MGCPCRQIRAALSHLPGGKFLVGLLPALPPKGPSMKMLAPVAGQSFHLAGGNSYFAAADRVVHVEPGDVAEMRRIGCVEAPADEPAPAKADAPFDPAAQEVMRAPDPLDKFDPTAGEIEHGAAQSPVTPPAPGRIPARDGGPDWTMTGLGSAVRSWEPGPEQV